MTIKVQAPNGAEIEFPEGTDAGTIQRVMSDFMKNGAPQPAPKPQVSQLESGARGAVQGLTFGFGDEIYGGVKGAANYLLGDGDFSQTYARERDAVREANKRAQEANPGTYLAGEIGGSLVVPAGGAARGLATGGKAAMRALPYGETKAAQYVGQYAVPGAAYGGTYAAGASEGQTAGAVAEDAAKGAGTGALIGLLTPPVVNAVGAVGGAIGRRVQAARDPVGTGNVKYAERVAQDFGASKDPQAIIDAGQRYAERAARYADDPTMMGVDLAGENTRRLVRQANNMPNDAVQGFQTKLARRQVTQPNRLVDAIEETLAPGGNFYDTVDKIVERRSAAARGAFKDAYGAPFNVKAGDDLARFLSERGYMRTLIQNTSENVKGKTGEDLMAMRPWEILHRVRMQIDKEIGKLRSGQNTSGWDMNDLRDLKREFSDLLEQANPKLGKAIGNFADESALKNALEQGMEDAANLAPEQLAKKIASLKQTRKPSPQLFGRDNVPTQEVQEMGLGSEAEMYRMGAARWLVDQVRRGNATNDRTKSVFGSPDMQLRLKAIFQDGAERGRFLRVLQAERMKNRTNNAVTGGSMSDRNLINAGEVMAPTEAISAVKDVATGNVMKPVLDVLGRTANRFSGMTPRVAEETLKIAMRKPGQAVDPRLLDAFAKSAKSAKNREDLIQAAIAAAAATSQ